MKQERALTRKEYFKHMFFHYLWGQGLTIPLVWIARAIVLPQIEDPAMMVVAFWACSVLNLSNEILLAVWAVWRKIHDKKINAANAAGASQ